MGWTKEGDNTKWLVPAAVGDGAKALKTFLVDSCSTSKFHPALEMNVIQVNQRRTNHPWLAGSWQESHPLTQLRPSEQV